MHLNIVFAKLYLEKSISIDHLFAKRKCRTSRSIIRCSSFVFYKEGEIYISAGGNPAAKNTHNIPKSQQFITIFTFVSNEGYNTPTKIGGFSRLSMITILTICEVCSVYAHAGFGGKPFTNCRPPFIEQARRYLKCRAFRSASLNGTPLRNRL